MKETLLYAVGLCSALIVCGYIQAAFTELSSYKGKTLNANLAFISFQEVVQNIKATYPELRKQHFLL